MSKKEVPQLNKVFIKPVGGKDADAIEVYPVDAKEAVSIGNYEYVNEDLGKAEWLEPKKPKKKKSATKKASKKTTKKEAEKTEATSIEDMTSDELAAFAETNNLEIENFENLNLVEKRAAVAEAVDEDM